MQIPSFGNFLAPLEISMMASRWPDAELRKTPDVSPPIPGFFLSLDHTESVFERSEPPVRWRSLQTRFKDRVEVRGFTHHRYKKGYPGIDPVNEKWRQSAKECCRLRSRQIQDLAFLTSLVPAISASEAQATRDSQGSLRFTTRGLRGDLGTQRIGGRDVLTSIIFVTWSSRELSGQPIYGEVPSRDESQGIIYCVRLRLVKEKLGVVEQMTVAYRGDRAASHARERGTCRLERRSKSERERDTREYPKDGEDHGDSHLDKLESFELFSIFRAAQMAHISDAASGSRSLVKRRPGRRRRRQIDRRTQKVLVNFGCAGRNPQSHQRYLKIPCAASDIAVISRNKVLEVQTRTVSSGTIYGLHHQIAWYETSSAQEYVSILQPASRQYDNERLVIVRSASEAVRCAGGFKFTHQHAMDESANLRREGLASGTCTSREDPRRAPRGSAQEYSEGNCASKDGSGTMSGTRQDPEYES
ncbi:hypothetical protein FB451DRAFT_1487880 [Mycena latifolia]|nr:hypothetical protein FB451DRAFT_1487880 [Mycena latifolia]